MQTLVQYIHRIMTGDLTKLHLKYIRRVLPADNKQNIEGHTETEHTTDDV
jgi:hypothetical protein